MNDIIIAGGGVAAFECACAARKQNPDVKITIYSEEEVLPYRRPALSALAASDGEIPGTFFIKSKEFYDANSIDVKCSVRVEKINPAAHTVELSDGQVVSYGKLIIATGSAARRIPVPGADGENCFVLRDYRDLMLIRRRVKADRCAVIGGGLLGLELADSLLKRGCSVTIIEGADRLLPRNLDVVGSGIIKNKISKCGNLELLVGKKVREITQSSVVLDDGTVPCDKVFFSTGVTPVYPECDGLAVDRGIVVDQNMKSSIEDIYAAGDCAQFGQSVCGLYTTASAMGKIAGVCVAGGNAGYVADTPAARLNALGVKLFSAGVFDDSLAGETEQNGENYRRIFLKKDGSLAGAILIGDVSEAVKLLKQLNS